MRFFFLALLSLILPFAAIGEPSPADSIFSPTVQVLNSHTLQVNIHIAPGGNLYQKKIHTEIKPHQSAMIASMDLPNTNDEKPGPDGSAHYVYKHNTVLKLRLKDINNDSFHLLVRYQGCTDDGICYPPQKKIFNLNLSPPYNIPMHPLITQPETGTADEITQPSLILIFTYFLTGLLMAFTPCVLPMLPIVAGIVLRKKDQPKRRGIFLALSYVLGMAICYSIGGIFVAAAGTNVAAFWQQPWLIVLFSLVFIVLASSLFGLFQFNLPSKWQGGLTQLSNQKNSGRLIGAFIMGGLSSLILSPCITPALLGGLAFIAQSGDVLIGGIALFAMGIGMGVPLLLIGWFGPKLFTRINYLLNTVKHLLGVLMLAVALLLLSRIIPEAVTQILWGLLFISAAGIVFWMHTSKNTPIKLIQYIFSAALGLYGLGLWYQAARFSAQSSLPILTFTEQHERQVQIVNALPELQKTLAAHANDYTLMQVTAKWCISCQIIESTVLRNPSVQAQLKKMHEIKLDLTNNNAGKSAITNEYYIPGPPTFILFRHNKQIGHSLSGEVSTSTFLNWLNNAKGQTK